MQLLINTGGKGTRLYPLTIDIPKPMLKINNKPMLEYLVDWAKKSNSIEEIIMLNGYKFEIIENYFEDGKNYNIKIIHSTEPYPLGSGGSIKYAEKLIKDRFFYISGDLICNVNLNSMLNYHLINSADFTAFVELSSHPEDSDILQVNEKNQVIKFISKHDDHTNAGNLSNSGLCIIEQNILKLMEKEKFTLETYLYPKILKNNLKMMAYKTDELIFDVGTFKRLKLAEYLLEKQNEK